MKQYSYRKFEASNAPTIQAYKKVKNALYPESRGIVNRHYLHIQNKDGFRGRVLGLETKRHGKEWQAEQVANALETQRYFENFFQELGLNY